MRSADDEVYCLHDLTLDRTTTATGPANEKSAEFLDEVRVSIPRLGPRWVGVNMPVLPRLTDVLRAIGGRAVLCLEAKDDDAYPLMTTIVEESGMKDTVMIKLPEFGHCPAGGGQERRLPDLCLSRQPRGGHGRCDRQARQTSRPQAGRPGAASPSRMGSVPLGADPQSGGHGGAGVGRSGLPPCRGPAARGSA